MVALVLSWVMRLQLAWPNTFAFIDPCLLSAGGDHARHDYGGLPPDGALFLGGFGNYLIPLMVGCAGYGLPLAEYDQLSGSTSPSQWHCLRRAS